MSYISIDSSVSPGGNIEAVTAAAEKSMKSKADEESEAGGDEEVVEVYEEDGVGGQAEHACGDDEGGQPEAAAQGGEPAPQFSIIIVCLFLFVPILGDFSKRPCWILFYQDSGGPIACSCSKVVLPPILEQVLHQDYQGGVEANAGKDREGHLVTRGVCDFLGPPIQPREWGEWVDPNSYQIEKPNNLQGSLEDTIYNPCGCCKSLQVLKALRIAIAGMPCHEEANRAEPSEQRTKYYYQTCFH